MLKTTISRALLICGAALTVNALTGCVSSTTRGTETQNEQCRQWGASLPSRSHDDTEQTRAEIQESYAVFLISCPGFEDLLPGADVTPRGNIRSMLLG